VLLDGRARTPERRGRAGAERYKRNLDCWPGHCCRSAGNPGALCCAIWVRHAVLRAVLAWKSWTLWRRPGARVRRPTRTGGSAAMDPMAMATGCPWVGCNWRSRDGARPVQGRSGRLKHRKRWAHAMASATLVSDCSQDARFAFAPATRRDVPVALMPVASAETSSRRNVDEDWPASRCCPFRLI